jgi:hypothetical protein
VAEDRYYSVDEVKARIAAGNFYYPCDLSQDPAEALFDAVGNDIFVAVMGDQMEAARQRRIGVDPDRVIDGETVRKEIAGG